MRLDHDRTTGRERRRGVATGNRKGEGKIRTAKDTNDADDRANPTKVGQRSHRRFGRVIDRRVEKRTVSDDPGEESKLERGASKFSFETRHRQGGFEVSERYEVGCVTFEFFGHRLKKTSAPLQGPLGVVVKCGCGPGGRRENVRIT